MTVFALLSAGGSPGVTTAGLALTLGWPSQVILAECDPSGGDILAGLLGGHLPASTGLLPLALEAGAGAEVPADTLWRQLVELDEERNRLLLAGISDPRQSAALQSSLPWIADALQAVPADVIADCGRLDSVAAVRPVLSAASLAVLVMRPTLRQASRAVSRVEMLTNLVGRDRVVLLLVGEGTSSGREIAKTLGVPVAGQLPEDGRTAAVLSDGAAGRHRLESRPLIRAATTAGHGLREAATAAGPLLGYSDQPVFSLYSPTLNGPTPTLNGPTPTLNGPTPTLNGPTPTLNGPTPTLNGPTPAGYGPTPAGYGPTPAGYGPTLAGPERPGIAPADFGPPILRPPNPGPPNPGRPNPGPANPGPPNPGTPGPGPANPGQPNPGTPGPGPPNPGQPGPPNPGQPGPGQPAWSGPSAGLRGLMPPESPVGHVSPDELHPGAPHPGGTPARDGARYRDFSNDDASYDTSPDEGAHRGSARHGGAHDGGTRDSAYNGSAQNGSAHNGSAQNGSRP